MEIWKILSQDTQLTTVMLDHMLELYQKSLPYEEKPQEGREPIKKATQIPLAVSFNILLMIYFVRNILNLLTFISNLYLVIFLSLVDYVKLSLVSNT